MSGTRPIAGQPSAAFLGAIGVATVASNLAKQDYLIDPRKFRSEGNWAFCRFDSDDVPAVRLGFQKGGLNAGTIERQPDPTYLQLHLEVMTSDGALLWLPSGVYTADKVISNPESLDISFANDDGPVFSFQGWPNIHCLFRSNDGVLEVDLEFALRKISVLPDCRLPHCLFAMWESMGEANGIVRYRDRRVSVSGKVFFDHTRVIERRHNVTPRHGYIYTTMYLEDGSGLFGYHSFDIQGQPIPEYCFGIYLDVNGNTVFLNDTELDQSILDDDQIMKSWRMRWRSAEFSLTAEVAVQRNPILKIWGSPDVRTTRKDFSIIPLVLQTTVHLRNAGSSRALRGRGLAEYFNADLWPTNSRTTAA